MTNYDKTITNMTKHGKIFNYDKTITNKQYIRRTRFCKTPRNNIENKNN